MKVLSVVPSDIMVTFEIPLSQLVELEKGLAMCQLNYDSTNPGEVKTKEMFEEFCEGLSKMVEGAEKHGIGSDS